MLTCRQATRLLSEARDRELDFNETLSLRFHTLLCRACATFGAQMPLLGEFSRRFAGQDIASPSEPGDPDAKAPESGE